MSIFHVERKCVGICKKLVTHLCLFHIVIFFCLLLPLASHGVRNEKDRHFQSSRHKSQRSHSKRDSHKMNSWLSGDYDYGSPAEPPPPPDISSYNAPPPPPAQNDYQNMIASNQLPWNGYGQQNQQQASGQSRPVQQSPPASVYVQQPPPSPANAYARQPPPPQASYQQQAPVPFPMNAVNVPQDDEPRRALNNNAHQNDEARHPPNNNFQQNDGPRRPINNNAQQNDEARHPPNNNFQQNDGPRRPINNNAQQNDEARRPLNVHVQHSSPAHLAPVNIHVLNSDEASHLSPVQTQQAIQPPERKGINIKEYYSPGGSPSQNEDTSWKDRDQLNPWFGKEPEPPPKYSAEDERFRQQKFQQVGIPPEYANEDHRGNPQNPHKPQKPNSQNTFIYEKPYLKRDEAFGNSKKQVVHGSEIYIGPNGEHRVANPGRPDPYLEQRPNDYYAGQHDPKIIEYIYAPAPPPPRENGKRGQHHKHGHNNDPTPPKQGNHILVNPPSKIMHNHRWFDDSIEGNAEKNNDNGDDDEGEFSFSVCRPRGNLKMMVIPVCFAVIFM